MATATTAQQTQTLLELRRAVADRFEDYVLLTATANGATTTLLDTANVNPGEQHYNGAQIVCLNGTNAGLIRTVTGTATTTGTLTLHAALTASTATSDTFDCYNRTGRKFKKAQYDRAINRAIVDAWPMGTIMVTASVSATFDAEVPEITVPVSVSEVLALEWQDEQSDWHTVPKARARGGDGWFADAASGQLRLNGRAAWDVDDRTLRVTGYGRQDALSADSDSCALAPEFIVSRAAYHLALGNVGQEDMAVRVNIFRDESERARVRIARLRDSWSQKVRST